MVFFFVKEFFLHPASKSKHENMNFETDPEYNKTSDCDSRPPPPGGTHTEHKNKQVSMLHGPTHKLEFPVACNEVLH